MKIINILSTSYNMTLFLLKTYVGMPIIIAVELYLNIIIEEWILCLGFNNGSVTQLLMTYTYWVSREDSLI